MSFQYLQELKEQICCGDDLVTTRRLVKLIKSNGNDNGYYKLMLAQHLMKRNTSQSTLPLLKKAKLEFNADRDQEMVNYCDACITEFYRNTPKFHAPTPDTQPHAQFAS